jgi:putative endonuclease
MYFVYIIYSVNFDKYYIGQTNNISERIARHNSGYENFTSKYIPWELVCVLEKQTRSEAVILENKLKNLNRERLKSFILKYRSRR